MSKRQLGSQSGRISNFLTKDVEGGFRRDACLCPSLTECLPEKALVRFETTLGAKSRNVVLSEQANANRRGDFPLLSNGVYQPSGIRPSRNTLRLPGQPAKLRSDFWIAENRVLKLVLDESYFFNSACHLSTTVNGRRHVLIDWETYQEPSAISCSVPPPPTQVE
jgi:hypothetical protein